MQQPEEMERWLRPKGWPSESQEQAIPASVLRRGSVHHFREKGGFCCEVTTAPGSLSVGGQDGSISAGSGSWEQVDLMPRPALVLSPWLSLLIPHSHAPSPCLLAGAWEGTVGTSQRAGGMGRLSWGSLVEAFRPAWAPGSRDSWLNSQMPGPHLLRDSGSGFGCGRAICLLTSALPPGNARGQGAL